MSKVWVTRDVLDTVYCCSVHKSKKKPRFSQVTRTFNIGDENMSKKKFVKVYGFLPEKGSCKQYESSLKEIVE